MAGLNGKTSLSHRLMQVSSYVPERAHLLDVGSDHAYLPLYLLEKGQIKSAIAGEVVVGPYQSALTNVKQSLFSHLIEVRLADGLDALGQDDEVDTITICGMGGRLISMILENGKAKLSSVKLLILQPNNCEDEVRTWLVQHGFEIIAETIVEENQKFYEIIVAEKGEQTLSQDELRFGPCLSKEVSSTFVKRWQMEKEKLSVALSNIPESNSSARDKLQKKITKIEEVTRVSKGLD